MTDVATPNAACARQHARMHLPRTLLGGTPAMRAAGELYLPREVAESAPAYQNRLARSTLFNVMARTVRSLAGRIFRKPIALGEDMPQTLRDLAENVDGSGSHLQVFAHKILAAAITDGLTHILVDFPRVPKGLTLADERALNPRPSFVHVSAASLLGFRQTNGKLTQVRFREVVTEDDGEFGEREVEQIRVVMTDSFEIYRMNEDGGGTWYLHDAGDISGVNSVPFVTIYSGERLGPLQSEPPLRDLSDLAVQHWQSSSDQRNILHVARVPVLFGKGFGEDENADPTVEIGAQRMVVSASKDASLEWVEHSGAAIGAGRQDLLDLEDKMAVLAMEPVLARRPGTVTATERAIDSSEASSALSCWAMELQDGLELAFGFAGQWLGLGLAGGGSVSVNRDFGITERAAGAVDALVKARTLGDLSRATFLRELQRLELLGDDIDTDAEAEAVEDDPLPPDLIDAP